MGFNRERGLPRVPTVHVTRMRTSQRARYHFMGCVRVRNRHLLCHSKVLRSAPFLQFSQATHLPLFYGRAKLHKPSTPLRPVVATCGTSTYALAKSLAAVLKPLVGYSGRILRSTSDLIDVMKTVTVNDDELPVSYDVKSLFTSIPVKESIEVCEERLRQDSTLADRTSMDVETIISLLRFCLTSTSFQYGGKHFKQVDGVAMGSPVSSVIADIFMENQEMKAFQGYGTVPRVWKRFVDDVLAVVRKAEVERFLDHLNNTHPNILFTMELEQNRSLPFMDVRFTRLPSGALEREVYRKPTHTNRYIHADSHQPMNVKSATIRCLVDRAFKVCSSNAIRERELETIRTIMVENGYKRKFVNKVIGRQIRRSERSRTTTDENKGKTSVQLPFIDGLSQEVRRIVREANIRCTFTAPNTLQKLHNVKDSLPLCSATHAIYSIKCKTCDEEYVGESMRSLDTRCKEHRDAIRLAQCTKSAVADHVLSEEHSQPHEIDWQSVRILDRAQGTTERRMKEAMLIYQRHPKMNRDIGMERSSVWNSVLWTFVFLLFISRSFLLSRLQCDHHR